MLFLLLRGRLIDSHSSGAHSKLISPCWLVVMPTPLPVLHSPTWTVRWTGRKYLSTTSSFFPPAWNLIPQDLIIERNGRSWSGMEEMWYFGRDAGESIKRQMIRLIMDFRFIALTSPKHPEIRRWRGGGGGVGSRESGKKSDKTMFCFKWTRSAFVIQEVECVTPCSRCPVYYLLLVQLWLARSTACTTI